MGGVDPKRVAVVFGIRLRGMRSAPFRVATSGDVVMYAWDADPAVRAMRMWEGIARCLLTRSGVSWTEATALQFASVLHSGSAPN
jgi:hypothetical protein